MASKPCFSALCAAVISVSGPVARPEIGRNTPSFIDSLLPFRREVSPDNLQAAIILDAQNYRRYLRACHQYTRYIVQSNRAADSGKAFFADKLHQRGSRGQVANRRG